MEEKTVSLSLGTILRECSKDPNLSLDHFYYFSLQNRENIHQIFKYKKFNEDFVGQLDCFNNGEYLIGMIRPSYDEFLNKLLLFLNIPHRGKIEDNDALTEQMMHQVERLKQVTSEQELEIEFPIIYKDLIAGRRYISDLQKMKQQEGYDEEHVASGEHYYYGCAMKKSLPNFIATQSELYRRFVTKRKELKELQNTKSFNGYLAKHFDLDKLYMYVMHEYLVKAESTKDKDEIKKYIALIEQYMTSSRKKDVSLTTDSGIKVDYEMIQKRLKNLKRVVDDNSSMVDWIIIPEGRDYSRVKREEHEPKTLLMDVEEMERLHQKGIRKNTFYETTPYVIKALGLRKYHGYIAYVYENGEVILDREYAPETPKTAIGDAIYNLKVADFETLSKYDKQVLMKHPRVGRMNHTSTWEKRVSKVIYRKATEEEKEETKQLVKRLREKQEIKKES